MSDIKRRHGRPDERQPLPAGHPDTWGLITRGTCLDGMPWPGPAAGSARQEGKWETSRHGRVRKSG
jgi:hypothetical protein